MPNRYKKYYSHHIAVVGACAEPTTDQRLLHQCCKTFGASCAGLHMFLRRYPLTVYIIIYCNSIIFHPICLSDEGSEISRGYTHGRAYVFFSYPGSGGDLLKNIYVFFRPTWRGQAAGKYTRYPFVLQRSPLAMHLKNLYIYIYIREKMKKGGRL